MENVGDILAAKGNEIIGISPDTTLYAALQKMVERNIGSLLVIDQAGKLLGLFTERGFINKIILKGIDCDHSVVRDAMTTRVLYVEPKTSISDCMNLMTEKHQRHLAVMENDRPVGVISIGDVVKAVLEVDQGIISRQAFEIGQLERYTSGI